jgi:ankyrin repeat protein
MRRIDTHTLAAAAVAALLVFGGIKMAPEPHVHSPISANEFVQAVATHRTPVVDLYLSRHLDPNARAAQDRPLILAAALEKDWAIVRRLLKAGASVDLGDENGMKPLMAAAMHGNTEIINTFMPLVTNVAAIDAKGYTALHYAVAAGREEAVKILLPLTPGLEKPCADGRDVLAMALDAGNGKIVEAILEHSPPRLQWTPHALRALDVALRAGNKNHVRLLLEKHAVPPVPEGRSVPLLAYAIASNEAAQFNMLLECGADPNTTLPVKYDKEFLAALPSKAFRNCIEDDRNVTVLMVAAGLGRSEYVRALLQAGADKNRATKRYKMLPLYFAAETGNWQSTQVLLGSGPSPEQLRIEISLATQRIALIKNGVPVFNSICSTGRSGYTTRTGYYVITDKERSHRSTIYKVEMPYFMRLSCLDFGMHEGVVPNYPASHGCIRLPSEAAHKLFSEIPIGTVVAVQ